MYKSARYSYPPQFGKHVDELMEELRDMLLTGRYILSAEVSNFEQSFAAYNGNNFARGVNSGTDALVVALMALGISRGDEVITQANTFHATAAAIDLVGATPVLVDADERTFLMNVGEISSAITDRTHAIIPVHLFGKPMPMLDLMSVCKDTGIHIIEDAAQAHGAVIHGRHVGTFGTAGCFSFHPSKNLAAAGDAGAIVSNDPELIARIDQFRSLGQAGQNKHVVVGLNSKLDAFQAVVLSSKLRLLDSWNLARAHVANLYRAELADLPVTFQATDDGERHVYHLFQLRTKRRDELLQFLQKSDIDAVIRYPTPIHLQPAFQRWGWKAGQFPIAEKLAAELICLPLRPDMIVEEVHFVCSVIREFFSKITEPDRI